MNHPQKVTKTLYDNNGFVADDFNDPEMRDMYDDLKINRLQYEELFRNFGCILRYEDKCFYLTRMKVTRQMIESRMEDYYLWVDIIDFLYDVLPSVEPGRRFFYSEMIKKVETSVNLPKKLQSIPLKLKKGTVPDNKTYMEELLDFLKKKQVLDEFVRDEDQVTIYQVTSVFSYFRDYVKSITLRSEEEKAYEGTV